ncbi:HTH psq-type domain-containing protein [Trichonephila clavipes]|nr:HTH psq-type domain-containing protein [Trichonephila clavipes]
MTSNSKPKRNVLNIETKLEILNSLAKGESGTSLAQFYNNGKSTISNIKKAEKLQETGFQMLNDHDIVTSMQEESDPVDNETDKDNDNNNECNKGPSNAGAFFVLETTMKWCEQQS